MIKVSVFEKSTGKPAKGQKVVLNYHGEQGALTEQYTDRYGAAHFDARPGSGKLLVNDVERRNCYIDWCMEVTLWSTI